MKQIWASFDWERSRLYKEALKEYPDARREDLALMRKVISEDTSSTILEVWAWSWFFSKELSSRCAQLIVQDPSRDQLRELIMRDGIVWIVWTPDDIKLESESMDIVRSFWAMHHSFNKQWAFEEFARVLKSWWSVHIGDVWSWSSLAKHFDAKVARYSNIGHEVSFWSDEFARSIIEMAWFSDYSIQNIDQTRWFDNVESLGVFLYKLHWMTKSTPAETATDAIEILWVRQESDQLWLNRPMKLINAIK